MTIKSKKFEAGPLQFAWHYDRDLAPQWGFRYLPGVRWRRAILLGRLTAWVGAR